MSSDPLAWKSRPFRELVRLAWPICVSMISYSAMTLIGTLFVGRLGPASLAAIGLGGITSFTTICFGFGVLRSAKVLVSQAIGAGRRERVLACTGATLVSGFGLGALALGVGPLIAAALPGLSSSGEAGRLASEYFAIRNLGAPLFLLAIGLREVRYGIGDSRSPMLATLVANIANIGFDALFIFGLGLGVAGAAWATVVASAIDLAMMLLAQRTDGFGLKSVRASDLQALLRLGWPLGVQFVLEVGAFSVLVLLLARVGEVDLAAHQIAIQLCHFSFLPALALGEAASVLSGQAVGAGADSLVRRIARLTLGAVSLYTGACTLLFAFGASFLAALFTDAPPVRALATRLIWIAAAFQLFDGANIVARTVLRGTGDVRFPALVGVITAWICTPPLTLLLGIELRMGAVGGWLALCLEIFCGTAIVWWRLESGHWRRAAERSRAELRREIEAAEPGVEAVPG